MSTPRGPKSVKGARAVGIPGDLDPKRAGEAMNDLMLKLMREIDDRCGQSDAERARRMNTTHQQVERVRKRIKVITLPLMIQWMVSHGMTPGDLINELWVLVQKQTRLRKK